MLVSDWYTIIILCCTSLYLWLLEVMWRLTCTQLIFFFLDLPDRIMAESTDKDMSISPNSLLELSGMEGGCTDDINHERPVVPAERRQAPSRTTRKMDSGSTESTCCHTPTLWTRIKTTNLRHRDWNRRLGDTGWEIFVYRCSQYFKSWWSLWQS